MSSVLRRQDDDRVAAGGIAARRRAAAHRRLRLASLLFGWAGTAAGVLAAARAGEAVSYRPPAWDDRGRAGAIEVPAGTRVVVLEGVGAGRRELRDQLDALVWVQSDFAEAERRGIARDGGGPQAEAFWQAWMAEEIQFLLVDRPWHRADLIVDGTAATGRDDLLIASAF